MQNSIGGLRPTGEETEFDGTTRSEQTAPNATAMRTSPPPGLLQMGITTPPLTPQGSFSSKFSPPLPVQYNPQVHMSHALPGHQQPLPPPRSPAPNAGGDGESGLLRDLVERYRGEMERLRSELNILRHENSALAEEIHSVMLQVSNMQHTTVRLRHGCTLFFQHRASMGARSSIYARTVAHSALRKLCIHEWTRASIHGIPHALGPLDPEP
jgi:hypothetical protein